jgi:hypothetical protein
MSVSDGQDADQNSFNNAFMSRTAEATDTLATVALNNADPDSGDSVDNVQKEINSIRNYLGKTGTDLTDVPSFSTNLAGSGGQNVLERVSAIDAKFSGSDGHSHTGIDGDGYPINALSVINLDKFSMHYTSFEKAWDAGESEMDISSDITGKGVANLGDPTDQSGVVATAPGNLCLIQWKDATHLNYGLLLHSSGAIVYGRLTAWVLNLYYKNASGVETAFTDVGSGVTLKITYREIYRCENRPDVDSSEDFITGLGLFLNLPVATATTYGAVREASASQEGYVSLTSQTFAGTKTFSGGISAYTVDVTDTLTANGPAMILDQLFVQVVPTLLTGANVTLPTPTSAHYSLDGAGISSIKGIGNPGDGCILMITNASGGSVDIINESGSAGAFEKIYTGTGANLALANNASILLMHVNSYWHVVGGSGGGASTASAIANTPSGNLAATDVQAALNELQSDIDTRAVARSMSTFTGTSVAPSGNADQVYTYTGSSAQTFTGFGTISGFTNGKQVDLVGTDDTNTLSISESDATNGWLMNGPIELTKAARIKFEYNSTLLRMVEVSRSVR